LVDNRQLEPTPPLFGTLMQFCRDLWHQKTRVPGLSYGMFTWSYI